MADEALRLLERAASTGDEEAAVRLLRERLKRGLLDEEQLALAAYLGDSAALALRPYEASKPDFYSFANGLVRWGRWIVTQAALALAQPTGAMTAGLTLLNVTTGVAVPLGPGERVVLGRSRSCDLQLESPSASRRHGQIELDRNGWLWATDLGSSNGTYVGGRPIQGVTRLRPGDRLQLGGNLIEIWASLGPAAQNGQQALRRWLSAAPPNDVHWSEILHWEQRVDRDSPTGTALRAALEDPPSFGFDTRDRPGDVQRIRRALLPLTTLPAPLRWGPDPPIRIARNSWLESEDWIDWVKAIESQLGLRAVRRLSSIAGRLDRPFLARAPNGRFVRLSLVPERIPAGLYDSSHHGDDQERVWQRWKTLQTLDLDVYQHPRLARVLDRREWEDPQLGRLGCLVLEHNPGQTLDQVVDPPPAAVVSWTREACAPMAAALKALPGPIPLSPQSVVMTRSGLVLHPVESWFVDDARMTQHEAGLTVTPRFPGEHNASLAPEFQVASRTEWVSQELQVVYSLASLLFRVLAGTTPYDPKRLLDPTKRRLLDLRPDLSPELGSVAERALAEHPADRYPDPLAFAEALAETPEGRS